MLISQFVNSDIIRNQNFDHFPYGSLFWHKTNRSPTAHEQFQQETYTSLRADCLELYKRWIKPEQLPKNPGIENRYFFVVACGKNVTNFLAL